MFNSTRVKIGVPMALLLAATIAALALWAWNVGATGGLTDSTGIKGIISYEVRDAAGNLKASNVIHNTDGLQGHIAVSARLFDESQSSVGANDAFRAVFLTSDQTGEASVGTGIATVTTNPQNDGTVDCTTVGLTRECVTSVTFTANAAAAITQLKLVKGANDTTTLWGSDLAVGDILAWQDVAITLANTDQLTVTWTVTIS
ncbi:MAG: hypothetical protein Q8P22_12930 [Chloroflexota bacterium]|nr:hypothetical protein [Chloroflexota bacterium]